MKKAIPSQEDIDRKKTAQKKTAAAKGSENSPRQRPKRKPISGRDRLVAPERKGYRRRFVRDEGDRVKRFEEAGYAVVTEETQTGDHSAGDPTQVGSAVTADGGGGVKLVLVEQKEEWYQEDQSVKQEQIDEQERAMFEEMQNKAGHYGTVSLQRGERQTGRR